MGKQMHTQTLNTGHSHIPCPFLFFCSTLSCTQGAKQKKSMRTHTGGGHACMHTCHMNTHHRATMHTPTEAWVNPRGAMTAGPSENLTSHLTLKCELFRYTRSSSVAYFICANSKVCIVGILGPSSQLCHVVQPRTFLSDLLQQRGYCCPLCSSKMEESSEAFWIRQHKWKNH